MPSTWPGMRAPHAFLGPDTTSRGASTLDWFGRGWVLCHAGADPAPLLDALQRRSMPARAQRIPPRLAPLFERRLVLVRPDGHVAWRGDETPGDADAVADTVRGA